MIIIKTFGNLGGERGGSDTEEGHYQTHIKGFTEVVQGVSVS